MQDEATVKLQLLRLYGALFALGAMLVETEWQWVMALVRVMDHWALRGLAQVRGEAQGEVTGKYLIRFKRLCV